MSLLKPQHNRWPTIVHLQLAPNASSNRSMSWNSSARLVQRTALEQKKMVLAHPARPHPPPANQSATRLVPTPRCGRRRPPGPSSQQAGAGTRRAGAPCAAAREAARGLRRREGAPATGASRGHLLGGAADRPAPQHPRPARPPPADPASAPHPFPADSRPRPRDGAENHGISRPARPRLRRGGCSRPPCRRLLRPALGPGTGGGGQL